MSVRAIYRIGRESLRRFVEDDGAAMAGYIAFSSLLAIFPFLIFATSLAGLAFGRTHGREAIDALFRLAPEHIARTLEPVLQEVLQGRGDSYVTVSIVLAIWLASNAFESFRLAFDRAYGGAGRRKYIARRLRALGFVMLGALVAAVLGFSVIFVPIAMRYAAVWSELRISTQALSFSFALGVVVFYAFLTLMHRYLPSHPMKGLRLWPGVLVTVVLWVAGALVFSYYLTLTPTYAITYGTLSGVIVTLIFFYLSGVAVIFGAEVNAALNARGISAKKPDFALNISS